MKRALPGLVALCVSLATLGAEPQTATLTGADAKALVMAALTIEQRRLPEVEANLDDASLTGRFLFYTVTWRGLPKGSVVVGNYAVDSLTGDVFSSTVSCDEKINNRLKSLQIRVRAWLHLTAAEYRRRKTTGPFC